MEGLFSVMLKPTSLDVGMFVGYDSPGWLFETPEIPLKERQRLLKKSEGVSHQIRVNYLIHRYNLGKFGVFGSCVARLAENRIVSSWINNGRIKQFLNYILKLNRKM